MRVSRRKPHGNAEHTGGSRRSGSRAPARRAGLVESGTRVSKGLIDDTVRALVTSRLKRGPRRTGSRGLSSLQSASLHTLRVDQERTSEEVGSEKEDDGQNEEEGDGAEEPGQELVGCLYRCCEAVNTSSDCRQRGLRTVAGHVASEDVQVRVIAHGDGRREG